MEQKIPRLLIAGSGSGCGKTTVTCAVLQALVDRGLKTGAFKCGPDYIDPMFHSTVIGAKSGNLDPYFFDEATLNALLAERASDREISIIEGVMGYYDGIGMTAPKASTYDVANATKSPVVLVVNAKGAALSLLATIEGFLRFVPNSGIRGVILNNCTPMTYAMLKKAIETRFGEAVRPLGYLPKLEAAGLESRHLGLVTAAEVEGLREKLRLLSRAAEQSLDLDGLLSLASEAPVLQWEPYSPERREPVRIAVARDRAFCFYYEDSLDCLRRLGAELIPFSPLTDTALPEDIQGLYLGGGYPELYARELSENKTMLASVRAALEAELPCIAECGGFMYLTEAIGAFPMVGALPGKSYDTGKLVRFGYATLTATKDNLLCRAGETIPAHEFHHWDAEAPGADFQVRKDSGRAWQAGHCSRRLYAGYPHFHFRAALSFAENFYAACLEVKHHDRKHQAHGY